MAYSRWCLTAVVLAPLLLLAHGTTTDDHRERGQERLSGKKASAAIRVYKNRLTPLVKSAPLLADYPEFIEPIRETARFEAPPLIMDEGADLHVRAWRFSYNARGIIEMPNRLKAAHTVLIVVHPGGIDDGQGWKTPEPAGVSDRGGLRALGSAHRSIRPKHV